MANGVASRHKSYDKFAGKWQRVRDVVSGQDEIHAKGAVYLPMLIDEQAASYIARVERTPFYNASWRTMSSFVGMLFRKPAILEVPKQLEPLLNDVTMSGIDFNSFAQEIVLEDIEVSRVGVLVDYPQVADKEDGTVRTIAEADAMGLRPSMVMYRTEDILNWHYEFVNNRTVLQQVRLAETAVIQKSEFEYEEEERIRVLDLFNGSYRVRLFKKDSGEQIGKDVFPLMNNATLSFIPFYIIGPDGGHTEVSEPILIDLVDLNIKHYQVSADYEHGCHITGLPTPVIIGAAVTFHPETNLPITPSYYIGSSAAWMLPVGGDAKFLEFTGQGLSELRENLSGKESQMAALGARMLTPEKAGVEAADTVAMRHTGENSILGSVAIAVSQGLTAALKTFAQWAGVAVTEDNVKFAINRDFMPYPMTPQALTALLGMVQAGRLSPESLFDLMKRGDLIDSDLTYEDEQGRIDADPSIPLAVKDPDNPANDPPEEEVEPKPKSEE